MKSKTVLAAGIIRDLLFRNKECLDLYLYELEHRCLAYKVLEQLPRDDGSIIIRIVCQYNNSDLIQFPDEQ